jgi:hypothetical protein
VVYITAQHKHTQFNTPNVWILTVNGSTGLLLVKNTPATTNPPANTLRTLSTSLKALPLFINAATQHTTTSTQDLHFLSLPIPHALLTV